METNNEYTVEIIDGDSLFTEIVINDNQSNDETIVVVNDNDTFVVELTEVGAPGKDGVDGSSVGHTHLLEDITDAGSVCYSDLDLNTCIPWVTGTDYVKGDYVYENWYEEGGISVDYFYYCIEDHTSTGITVNDNDSTKWVYFNKNIYYLTEAVANSIYEPIKGDDDNYVTDAEKLSLSNIHAPGSDDQDLSGYQLTSEKDNAFGYCGLDSGGKVPISNLPTTLLQYQGVWNASSNSPTLTNPDLTKIGYVYNVSAAGTQFGLDFGLGDWLIYNSIGVPEKADNSDDVTSVNGATGAVVLNADNIDDTTTTNKFVDSTQIGNFHAPGSDNQVSSDFDHDQLNNTHGAPLELTGGTMTGSIVTMTGDVTEAPIKVPSGSFKTITESGTIEHFNDTWKLGIDSRLPAGSTTTYLPSPNNLTTVKTTTAQDSSSYGYWATGNGIVTGLWYPGVQFLTPMGTVTNQRIHIDLGSTTVINKLYYENSHNEGTYTATGAKNFTLWGSNSVSDFNDTVYANDGTWTQITGLSQSQFDQHIAANQADPKYITFDDSSFRYYAIKISDNWGDVNWLGLRRLNLQYQPLGDRTRTIVLAEDDLTENSIPVASTGGRLIDSVITQSAGDVFVNGNQTIGTDASGDNLVVKSTLGMPVTASMLRTDWTLDTAWDATNDSDTALNKNGTFTTAATYLLNTPTANSRYLVTMTVLASVTGGFSYSYGGITSDIINPTVGVETTFTQSFQLATTVSSIIVNPASSASRFKIKSIVITEITGAATNGNITAYGNIYTNSINAPGSDNGIILRPNGTTIIQGPVVMNGALSGISTLDASSTITTNTTATLAPTIAYQARNVNASSAGTTVRSSGSYSFTGTAWNTTPTASSKTNAQQIYLLPISGTTTSSALIFRNAIVDGVNDTTELMRLTSSGLLTASGGIYQNSVITSAIATTTTPTRGFIATPGTPSLVGTPVRISPSVCYQAAVWDTDDSVSRNNIIQNYMTGTSGATTSGTLTWANDTVNGSLDTTVLMQLTTGGLFTVGKAKIGGSTDYTEFEADGTMVARGAATTWRDEIFSSLSLQQTGAGVSLSLTEGTMDFTTGSNLSDYGIVNVQLNHDRISNSLIYPHIHWFQAQNNTPNWLLQYRIQLEGGTKTTAWTNYACNTNAHTYVSGTLNQISYGAGISVNGSVSDIIQFRILRDNANTSTVFSGADPYTAAANLVSFDVHIECDTLGSSGQYTK